MSHGMLQLTLPNQEKVIFPEAAWKEWPWLSRKLSVGDQLNIEPADGQEEAYELISWASATRISRLEEKCTSMFIFPPLYRVAGCTMNLKVQAVSLEGKSFCLFNIIIFVK